MINSMSLEKFVKKAKKKKRFHAMVSTGLFGYCDEERVIHGVNNAVYVKVSASKGVGSKKKTYYLTHAPENEQNINKMNNLYYNLKYDYLIKNGFLIYEWDITSSS